MRVVIKTVFSAIEWIYIMTLLLVFLGVAWIISICEEPEKYFPDSIIEFFVVLLTCIIFVIAGIILLCWATYQMCLPNKLLPKKA